MEEQNEQIIAQYSKKDAEILKENGLPAVGAGQMGSIKSHYWKFIGGFFALMLVGIIGLPMVAQYMEKQEDEARAENTANYMKFMTDLQERLENDKDGGATPEETLELFTAALKAGDIEQASKYFVFEPEEGKERLVSLLENLEEIGEMKLFVEYLGKVRKESSDPRDSFVWFSHKNSQGMVDFSVEITKSKYSTVWKIENIAL
ncbi:hypothetical protein A2372_02910 [Candidatus Wolfebacteria bacterium RIFOXYB1_FULL_54_12]|uniref:DUF4878 domain-containing protein n=1 Tax=Candidatus Wolfebacteria bacterium RIFOXYB1_FULL_54_12 TaxID=1802559 RepID=A0A1F8DXP4_9BACT|nr:MAG: hypothetical protein A2372_02910 [Candidatus Wolfebacteria bacterium RIFOXYB1_FULL_54_12]